jgi:hypothetical protein
MGVFSGLQEETSYSTKELCKRDYERDIGRMTDEKNATVDFLSSVDTYLDKTSRSFDVQFKFSLPELYGILSLTIKRQDGNIKSLMEEWERNK